MRRSKMDFFYGLHPLNLEAYLILGTLFLVVKGVATPGELPGELQLHDFNQPHQYPITPKVPPENPTLLAHGFLNVF